MVDWRTRQSDFQPTGHEIPGRDELVKDFRLSELFLLRASALG